MEYSHDIGPAGRLRPGHLPPHAGDVAEDIEQLIQSARRVNADALADPAVPLASLL
jgi:hypothetical protein